MTYTDMPIERDHLETDGTLLPVKPGTNAHELLSVLVENRDLGFTAGELAELTDVPRSSVGKTLSRLKDRGLVEKIDEYWLVADDALATHVGALLSLEALEARYGDDYYGRNDDWADGLPDLGDAE
jgi:hypothetical protein